MKRPIAAVVFATVVALALVAAVTVPGRATALSLTLRVTPTTV